MNDPLTNPLNEINRWNEMINLIVENGMEAVPRAIEILIHEAMKMLSLADSSKIGIMIGCMDEASAGISAGLHLALARPEVTLADLDGHIGLEGDPTAGSVRVENGFLFPSHEPGLGCGGIR